MQAEKRRSSILARLRGAVERSTNASVSRARDGRIASVGLDVKKALLDADVLEAVCAEFWVRYRGFTSIQVAAPEGIGAALLGAVLRSAPTAVAAGGLIVRSERKTHDFGRLIEGAPDPSRPCVLLDDLVNSGATLERMCRALRRMDLAVGEAFVVIDRENPELPDRLLRLGLTTSAIVRGSEVGLPPVRMSPIRPARPAPLRRVWRTGRIGLPLGASDRHRYLAATGDTVVVASPYGGVAAVAAASGERLWLHPGFMHDAWDRAGGVLVGDAGVVATLAGGETASIEPGSGRVRWRRRFGCGAIGAPIRVGGAVAQAFVHGTPSGAATIVRFREDDSRVEGEVTVDEPSSNIVALGDRVFFGARGGGIVSCDADDRVERLGSGLPEPSFIVPLPDGKRAVVILRDGAVAMLDPDGRDVAPLGKAAAVVERAPTFLDGTMLLPSKRPWLVSLRVADGAIEPTPAFAHGRLLNAPLHVGDVLLAFDSAGWLYGLGSELDVLWMLNLGEGIADAVAVARDGGTLVVVLFFDASMAAFEAPG